MKLLIYDDKEEEWRYTHISFSSLLKVYILLDLARFLIFFSIIIFLGVILALLGV